MKPEILQTLENMKKRGYTVHVFDSAEEMRDFTVNAIPDGESVGFGGSVTVADLGIYETLQKRGIAVYHHRPHTGSVPQTTEEAAAIMLKAHTADNYIMSANAIASNGKMLNIDGTGNRLAALLCGPRVVYILVGANKFVDTEDDARQRLKTKACPDNARRLNRQTPCAATGACADCSSPGRICNNEVWTLRVPREREYHICVAPEELGY